MKIESNKLILISFICLCLFSCLVWLLKKEENILLLFDDFLGHFITGFYNQSLETIALGFTHLASYKFCLLIATLLALILLLKRNYLKALVLLGGVIGSRVIRNFWKMLIHRPRLNDGHPLIEGSSSSFPSGHMLYSITLYGLLVFIIYLYLVKYEKSSIARWVLVLYVAFIFCIGWSRVYLGIHYVSDVVGGSLLGVSWLLLLIVFLKRARKEFPAE